MNKKCLPKVKTTVLPIGIDLSDYKKKRQPSKLLNGLERPIFLSTSAIVNFKRIDLTIKAIAKLEKGSLVQTSKGNMKDNIVSLGKELLGKRFEEDKFQLDIKESFFGGERKSQEEVIKIMQEMNMPEKLS